MEINRFCANSSLVYFLRTMGPTVTRRAALVHDALIEEAFHRIVGTGQASRGERGINSPPMLAQFALSALTLVAFGPSAGTRPMPRSSHSMVRSPPASSP